MQIVFTVEGKFEMEAFPLNEQQTRVLGPSQLQEM